MHAIDTHKAVTRLETTGMSRQTAEAVVEIFDTVANAAATDLATKADLGAVAADVQDLRDTVQHLNGRVQDLDNRMHNLEDGMQHLNNRMRDLDNRMHNLEDRVVVLERTMATKSDLAEVKTDIIRWNVGLMLTVAAVMIAAVKLI